MRRATVLVLTLLPIMGTTSPAAETPKPLKTHKADSNTARLADDSAPLPDPDVIQPLKQHFEYVLPGNCVARIEKTPGFKCQGPDKDHMKCDGIAIIVHGKIDDCLEIHVEKEK